MSSVGRPAREEAAHLESDGFDLIASVAHDLRAPLNAIIGFAQLLDLEDRSPKDRRALEHIRAAGEELLDLFEDLLEIASVAGGRLAVELVPVDLVPALGAAVDLLGSREAGTQLSVPRTVDPPVEALGDRDRLVQLLARLMRAMLVGVAADERVDVSVVPATSDRVRIVLARRRVASEPDAPGEVSRAPHERLGLLLAGHLTEAMGGRLGGSLYGRLWIELRVVADLSSPPPAPSA